MNSRRLLVLSIFHCLISGLLGPAQAAAVAHNDVGNPVPVGEFGLIENLGTSPGFRTLIEAHSTDEQIGPDGAIGRNRKSYLDAAEQRGAGWYLMRGVIDNSRQHIELAIQAMEYGFAHQNPAGYFENSLGASPLRAIEADAFFLQAFGRIALVVRASPYRQQFETRLERLKPQLASAMSWLAQNAEELHRQDRNAVNRLWFDAMAFILNGMILGDTHLIEIGHEFMKAGLQGQMVDGSFNEHKGSDTSYQAVSMLNIGVLLSYEADLLIAARLRTSLVRASEWEAMRIDGNGKISAGGNSRTGLGQETYFGKPKDINYQEVAQALLYASYLAGVPQWRSAAEAVTAVILRPR